jgi:DNA polymerase
MQSEMLDRIRRVLLSRLESLERAGVGVLPKVKGLPERFDAAKMPVNKAPAAEAASPSPFRVLPAIATETTVTKKSGWQPQAAGTLFDAGEAIVRENSSAPTLDVLRQEVAGCTRCEELAGTRTQTVFGVGNPNARLCFLGEAPGADEDRLGEPFVGRAGQLLTKIIEACRMKREDAYILNMIKCRPPGNRNPLPNELANCRGYLERQLALIRPEFICCLGAVAAQNLLGTMLSIGKLRGKIHDCRGAKVVCTYHPAYLLRNPAAKKDTREDMKLLLREMGVEL